MDLELTGRVAVVAGASRGIGLASARALAREGCRLVLAARGREALEREAAGLAAGGVPVEAAAVDLFVPGGPEELVARALARFGRIDALVNVAGGSSGSSFEQNTLEQFAEGFARNYWPALRATKAALPALLESRGVVVHVASIWGREAGGTVAYNNAKAALISLVKSSGRELAAKGVRVVGVAPGSVLHPGGSWERRQKADPEGIARFVREDIPAGRFGRPEEIGDVVAFLCSARASWVTATTVVVDGGQTRGF